MTASLKTISTLSFDDRVEAFMRQCDDLPMAQIVVHREMLDEIHLMLRTLVFGLGDMVRAAARADAGQTGFDAFEASLNKTAWRDAP